MSDLAPAAVLLGIVVILAVLLLGPLPRLAAWFERGVWLGASGGAARRRLGAEHVLEWLSPSGQSGARDVAAPLLSFIAVISIFAYLGFGRSLVSPEADLGLIYAVSVVCLLAGRLVEGGLRRGTTWSLASGLLAVLQTLVAVVPGLIGMAALALAAESVTLHDIARAQGGAPWRWWGFDNPGLVVCAFALLLSAAPTGAENRDRFALLEGARSAHPSRLSSLFARGSEWLHAWITAALVVTLYFGAWQIPLVSAVWAPTLGTQAAGAALFVVKLWMAMLVIVAGRALAARVGVGALVGPFAMRLLPAALAFGAGAVVWAEAAARVELPPATVGALTLGVCFATALYLALRMRTASNRDPLAGSVNPWL